MFILSINSFSIVSFPEKWGLNHYIEDFTHSSYSMLQFISLADYIYFFSLFCQSCQGGQEGKAGSQETCCPKCKGKICCAEVMYSSSFISIKSGSFTVNTSINRIVRTLYATWQQKLKHLKNKNMIRK